MNRASTSNFFTNHQSKSASVDLVPHDFSVIARETVERATGSRFDWISAQNGLESAIICSLVGGNSLRSTVRITGIPRNQVTRIIGNIGAWCSSYQDSKLTALICRRFVCSGNPIFRLEGSAWIAMDVETQLVPSWVISSRPASSDHELIADLGARTTVRPLSLVIGGKERVIDQLASVEQHGLRICDKMNGRPVRLEKYSSAVALFLMYHNFAHLHSRRRITPAMAAGIDDHPWTVDEIVWKATATA